MVKPPFPAARPKSDRRQPSLAGFALTPHAREDITMAKKLILKERKLGRERASGQAYPDDGLIEIDPRLTPRQWLSTLIHEAVHMAFPEAPEPSVAKAERVITAILWRAGIRRIHQ